MLFQQAQRSLTFTNVFFYYYYYYNYLLWGYQHIDPVVDSNHSQYSPKSGPRSSHSRSSGPASKPVMGGVRRERIQIIHLLSLAGRPMKLSGAETPLWQLIAWKEAACCVYATRGDLVDVRKVWEGKVRTIRHRWRNTTQPRSACWGSETRVKRRWFSSKLCWQSWI